MADLAIVPGRLNLTIWAGNTETVTLTWPDGVLDGTGPWTAGVTFPDGTTLDLPVAVVDDVQTLTIPAATSDHLHEAATWVLEDAATTNVEVSGTFRVSDQPGPSTVDATVVIDEQTVVVTAEASEAVQANLTAHEADTIQGGSHGGPLDAGDVGADPAGSAATVQTNLTTHQGVTSRAGAHGRVLLDFGHAGFDDLTKVVATADGDQVFTESVVAGRGRVTGTEPPDGNHRVWYLHPDTNWSEGRVTGLWWGPSQWDFSPGNRPQIGFVLGAQEYTPGSWVALVVWYNITGTPTSNAALVVNGWDVDGTTLQQGSGGNGGSIANVNRAARVIHARHQEFLGSELSVMTVAPPWSAVVPNGTPIVVSGMADSDYDIAAGTASNPSAGDTTVTSTLAAAPANPTDPIAGGTLTPAAPWNAAPYMVSAERVGNSLRVSQWAYGAPPPDEGDPRTFTVALSQGAMDAFPTGPGLHGFMIGHCHSGSYAEVGNILFEQIS